MYLEGAILSAKEQALRSTASLLASPRSSFSISQLEIRVLKSERDVSLRFTLDENAKEPDLEFLNEYIDIFLRDFLGYLNTAILNGLQKVTLLVAKKSGQRAKPILFDECPIKREGNRYFKVERRGVPIPIQHRFGQQIYSVLGYNNTASATTPQSPHYNT